MGDQEHPEREHPEREHPEREHPEIDHERHSVLREIDEMMRQCQDNPKALRALKRARHKIEVQMMNRQQWINYWMFKRPHMWVIMATFAVEVGLAMSTGDPLLWAFAAVIGCGWGILAIDTVLTAPKK